MNNNQYIVTLYYIYGSMPWKIQALDVRVTNATKIRDIIAKRSMFANYVVFEFRKKAFLFDTRTKVRQLRTNLTVAELIKKITSL